MRGLSVGWNLWLVISALCLVGCATPQEREVNLAQTAPKAAHESDLGWYAACGYETPGGHVGPWAGPLRSDKADALKDALDHDRAYPGHHASVVH
jgi:hypothetical protein